MAKYYSGEQLELFLKKGISPYDFMNSIDEFKLTSLPEKKDCYNKMDITEIDYRHAVNVRNTFNVNIMEEYTLLYSQTDVLLFADVMENFRDVCMQTYKLDPAWYYTAPGLAWNAFLKTSWVNWNQVKFNININFHSCINR